MLQVHDVLQGSDEWLELRADKYTGNGAHKLLKHHGLIKVVNGVASAYALAEITGFGGNFHTKRGHLLEDEAIDLYEQIYKTTVQRPGFVTNSKFPTCGYSPDGLDDAGPLIECKAFNPDKHMKIYNGDIPFEILAQIHFGLLITERKVAHLVIYNPDLEAKQAFKVLVVKTNRNIQTNFKRKLAPVAATV